MRFVDTNVFIRYLTRDDAVKAAACLALFQRVERGGEELMTSEAVIGYRLAPDEIRDRLRPVLTLAGLNVPQKRTCLRALDLAVQQPMLDFEDVLSAAHMEHAKISEIISYDTDVDRFPGLTRHAP